MNGLFFLVSFSTLIYCIDSQYRFNCYENYCSINECPEFSCENGRILENATECGCCHLCIKTLMENDACKTAYYKWERQIAECGPGLVCKKTSGIDGICAPSECLKRKRIYEKETESQLKPYFECDHFGNFEPSNNESVRSHVVCINDVLCFCVDKDGKRIFGTDFAKGNSPLSEMNCDCSRDINDFKIIKTVEFEKLPRCLPNGNYDPLQCVHNKCFCMESSRYREDEIFEAKYMKKLSCYNDNRYLGGNRKTKCLEKREEEIMHLTDENLIIIGDRTQCESDGTYYPLQCKKGRCSCVNTNGEILISNLKKEEGDLLCRCIRDKELIQSNKEKTESMESFEKIKCNSAYTDNNSILSKSFITDFIKH